MRKKNLYFRTVLRRDNLFQKFVLDIFFGLCSWPRLLLEVFIRKNFGERYFRASSALTIVILLAIIPAGFDRILSLASSGLAGGYTGYGGQDSNFWGQYATWYLFLLAFIYFSYKRWQEVRHNPSTFDFGRFSLSAGTIHDFFYDFKLFRQSFTPRQIVILLEPGGFFIAGLILALFGQAVGWLWVVCSVFYSLGYAGAYRKGDDFVLDRIDEMILNEQMEDSFVNNVNSDETKEVNFYLRKPTDADLRQKVAKSFFEDVKDEEIADVR